MSTVRSMPFLSSACISLNWNDQNILCSERSSTPPVAMVSTRVRCHIPSNFPAEDVSKVHEFRETAASVAAVVIAAKYFVAFILLVFLGGLKNALVG